MSDSMSLEEHFLEAWCDAVRRIGEECFELSVPLEEVTDKEQARPDWEMFISRYRGASGGEKRFMLAVFQFFNAEAVRDWAEGEGIPLPTLDELARLDDSLLSIITRLMHSYRGW